MIDEPLDRRTLIKLVGPVSIVGVAGCADEPEVPDDGQDDVNGDEDDGY